jgi:hypothetical protein
MLVATWNMQGTMGEGESKMQTGILPAYNEGVEVFCLQECGELQGIIPCVKSEVPMFFKRKLPTVDYVFGTLSIGSGHNEKGLYAYVVEWDEGANRCNLAILSSLELDKPEKLVFIENPVIYGGRPVIGIKLGEIYILNIHASASGGGDVVDFLEIINSFYSDGKMNNFFLAGDFNREPGSFELPEGFTITKPNFYTHGFMTGSKERTLDYGIGNINVGFIDLETQLLSDHRGVFFSIDIS